MFAPIFKDKEEIDPKITSNKDKEKNYTIPIYFKDDLLSLINDKAKPAYKWILLGPKRSGSGIHIDPFKTSAWNILFSGKKRWIMIKEEISQSIIIPKSKLKITSRTLILKQFLANHSPLEYFYCFLPMLLKSLNPSSYVQFIQNPGETVFVPGGWWHAVVNLENSFAFTQNFLSGNNFDKGWEGIMDERRKLGEKLYQKMKSKLIN
jgi:histone arginine demethylase JMJD6